MSFTATEMRDWGAKKELSLAQQYLFLKKSELAAGSGALSANLLTWRHSVRPSTMGRQYQVKTTYSLISGPSVFVEDPDLCLLAPEETLPHVYRNPLRLCLYYPDGQQWAPTMRLDQTIVPWTTEWLYHFEDWLASGQWRGGGRHPGDGAEPPPPRWRKRIGRRRKKH